MVHVTILKIELYSYCIQQIWLYAYIYLHISISVFMYIYIYMYTCIICFETTYLHYVRRDNAGHAKILTKILKSQHATQLPR